MQDIDPAVRGSMVKRIPEVISRLKNKDKAVSLLQNFSHDSDVYLMGAYVEALGKSCTLVNPKDPQALVVLNGALPIMKKLVKKAYVEGHVNILAEFSTHVGQMTAIYSGMVGYLLHQNPHTHTFFYDDDDFMTDQRLEL